MDWPKRGIYFFRQADEQRSNSLTSSSSSGSRSRVIRVGTHAGSKNSRSTLWGRLSNHRGPASTGGGNHRGSVFRKLVGEALMQRDKHICPTWRAGKTATKTIRKAEQPRERAVSAALGEMELLWLAIDDPPSRHSLRGVIERNAIALLSNYEKPPLDTPSPQWLGHFSLKSKVRQSGLWNQRHVEEKYDPSFLDTLEELIGRL